MSFWGSTRASECCYSHQQENKLEYEYLGVSSAPLGVAVEGSVLLGYAASLCNKLPMISKEKTAFIYKGLEVRKETCELLNCD